VEVPETVPEDSTNWRVALSILEKLQEPDG